MNRCAVIQMVSSPNIDSNLIEAERLIKDAAKAGADLVVLPENFAFMGLTEYDKLNHIETEGSGPIQEFLSRAADQYSVWIVGGTIPLAANVMDKIRASCLVFDSHGQKVVRYDKIHLFDVDVPDSDESYMESDTIEAGTQTEVIQTPFGMLGLAICYDLRFPETFRQLLDQGMEILAVPSAFTRKTGAAHWELLVRVRALENLCYVLAANQGGRHLNGRETYGDSMIVDPWGEILDRVPNGASLVCTQIDRNRLNEVRVSFPALQHRRLVGNDLVSNKV